MAPQPRALDVRTGPISSEAGSFRSALLLLDAAERVISATPGALAFLSHGMVTQCPAPLDLLHPAFCEMVQDVRRSGHPVCNALLLWKGPDPSDALIPLEVDMMPSSARPGSSSAELMTVAIRRVAAPADTSPLQTQDTVIPAQPQLMWEVGHEIKNSLVALRTFVDLLLEKQPKAEMARVVRHGLDKVSAAAGRLLQVSQPKLELRAVNLHTLIPELVQIVQFQAGSRNIEFEQQLQAPRSRVRAEPQQLEQAVLNLMMNGLEAMGANGRLSVGTSEVVEVLREGQVAETCLEISVRDTGSGISASNMSQLFEEHFTTKKAGSGLGLPITRRIVLSHGGRIEVSSTPGEGSCFRILLPLLLP